PPPVVPPPVVPPPVAGGEEFFDLPERNEGLGGIAGLAGGGGRPPADAPGEGRGGFPAGGGGRMPREATGPVFQFNYPVEGTLAPEAKYVWVIVTARKQKVSHPLTALQLSSQNTVQIRAGVSPLNSAPYQTYVAIDRGPGMPEEAISEVVTFR